MADAGIVQVLQGTASGLSGVDSQTWSQNAAGSPTTRRPGTASAARWPSGNVTGSSEPDLAIGVPEEDGTSTVDYGVVHILVSTDTGLTAAGSTLWSQASTGIGDTAESGDGFGASLAIGRLDDSSPGDVVVGVPGEDVGAAANAGVVQTIRGSVAAPTGAGSQTFGQGTPGIADNPETGDEFGYSVAVADLGGSTALDLAVGAPGESGTSTSHYGVVHVIPGGAGGLTATGSQQWSQNSAGVADSAESEDRFGASLGAADYGGTVGPDLAIGVPGESVGTIPAAGIVQVLQGSATFLTGSGSNTLGQNSPGVADNSEASTSSGCRWGADQRVVADRRSSSAGASSTVAAGRICSSCSTVRALAIGAVTRGWASSQASAIAGQGGVVRGGDLVERLEHGLAAVVQVGARRPRRAGTRRRRRPGRYLPVRKPLASAKYGRTGRSHASATGSSVRSKSRSTRL